MANAVAYIRVSSKAQDYGLQRSAIEKEAQRRGDSIAEWYAEKRSAKTMQRPELDRLRADLRAGVVRKVYGFRFDRFLRTGPRDAYRLAEEVVAAGAELVTVADGLHLKPGKDDVTTTVLLFAFSLAAQLERAAINDRISAARERVEAQGRSWGRPRRFGPRDLERVRVLHKQGLSHRAIAQRIHAPKATVTLALKRASSLGA